MLEFGAMNYWAIAVAWLISVVVGAFWYSPAGFGKQWSKLSGVNHMKMPEKEATQTITFVALSALIQVLVLAVVIHSLAVTSVLHGLVTGVVLWLGFAAATSVGNTLYQQLSWKFWWLNNSYFLLVMAANAVILALWQ